MTTTTEITADDLLALEGAYLEIHCDTDALGSSLSRRIKATGGHYSECRGDAHKRFVHVPITDLDLADEVIRTHGYPERREGAKRSEERTHVTVIFRHHRTERYAAAVVVQYVHRTELLKPALAAVHAVAASINGSRKRGYCTADVSNVEVTRTAAAVAESQAAAAAARLAAAQEIVAKLSPARLAEQLAEGFSTDRLNALLAEVRS